MGAEYKVMKIDEMTRLGELDKLERYYRHTIKTKGGVILTVDVDERAFTADKVAPILALKATEADKILAL